MQGEYYLGISLPPGSGYEVLKNVSSPLAVVVDFVVGLLAVFAGISLLALVFLVNGIVRLEVLRQERWCGQLRALGCTARQLRVLLLARRLPVLVGGAAVGAILGVLEGPRIAGSLTTMFGTFAFPWHPLVVVVAAVVLVLAIAAGTSLWSTRRLGTSRVSAQLRAIAEDRPAVSFGALRRGGAAYRFGVATVGGRKRRAIAAASMTLLATAVAVFGAVLSGIPAQLANDPGAWGFHYDYEVAVAPGSSLARAVNAARELPGVSAASEALYGTAQVAGTRLYRPFILTDPSLFDPQVLVGRRIVAGDEVEVGTDVAALLDGHLGEPVSLSVGASSVTVKVVGIVRDLEDQGQVVVGALGLARPLREGLYRGTVLVQCAATKSCSMVGRELRSEAGGAWAVTSVRQETTLPFAGVMVDVAGWLSLVFAVLAGAAALYAGLLNSGELVPAYGLLRAIGAKRRQVAATGIVQVAVMILPALAAGILFGFLASHWVVSVETASIGGLQISGSAAALVASASLVGAAACLGAGVPIALTTIRTPARSMGGTM